LQVRFKLRAASPLDQTEGHIALPPLPVTHEGAFSLSLFWKDELLGALRILGIERPSSEGAV
jgi:hypothetical protein